MGGSPPLQSGGQNLKWPTSGQDGYITPATWGAPTASEWGAESQVAHKWARWLHNPCHPRGSPPLQSGGRNWRWPTSGQGGYITLATWGGPPPLQSGGRNQRWPTRGQGGYITPATWGGPHRFRVGGKTQVAHKWARWLHNPCRLGVPTASQWGAKSKVAHKWARWLHNPCRLGGPPPLQSGGRN